jgi:hypothetical protein
LVCVDEVFRLGRIKATHRLHARRNFGKKSFFFSVYAGFVEVIIFENRQNFLTANANGGCCSRNFSYCLVTDLPRRDGEFARENERNATAVPERQLRSGMIKKLLDEKDDSQ